MPEISAPKPPSLDLNKLAGKAEARGLITAAQRASMTDGTVSIVDTGVAERAWDKIARKEEKGAPMRELAADLRDAVVEKRAKQGRGETFIETMKDPFFKHIVKSVQYVADMQDGPPIK